MTNCHLEKYARARLEKTKLLESLKVEDILSPPAAEQIGEVLAWQDEEIIKAQNKLYGQNNQ